MGALLVVKALLIFKADWLADRLDSEVIWIVRIWVMTYSGLRFFIDFHQPTKSFHTLSLLTSTNMKSSFGPGLGMFTMLIILLLTFVVLQIKTSGPPSEDNPEDQNSMKKGLWIGIAVFALTAIYLACY